MPIFAHCVNVPVNYIYPNVKLTFSFVLEETLLISFLNPNVHLPYQFFILGLFDTEIKAL